MSSNIFIFYHRKIKYAIIFSLHLLLISCREATPYPYPAIDATSTIEEYYGNKVSDPFRILEDLENESVKNWFDEQQSFYSTIVKNITQIDSLKQEISTLYSQKNTWTMMPCASGEKIFYSRFYSDINTEKIFCSDVRGNQEILIYNLDSLSKRGISVNYYESSPDGKYLAIGMSGGDEMSTIHILDIESKKLLPEKLPFAMGGNPQWLSNSQGLFYQQMKESGHDETKPFEDSKVKLHLIGTNPEEDKIICSRNLSSELSMATIDFPQLYTFPSNDKVLLAIHKGTERYSRLYWTYFNDVIKLPAKDIKWSQICSEKQKVKSFTMTQNHAFLITNDLNPNGTLIKIALDSLESLKVILDGENEILEELMLSKDALYIKSLKNGSNELFRIDTDNLSINNIALPYSGSINMHPGYEVPPIYLHLEGLLLGLENWVRDRDFYYYSPKNATLMKSKINLGNQSSSTDLIVKKFEVLAHDGKLVPLTIIHKRDIKLNRKNPTIVYAYGAYGFSMDPYFSITRLPWLNRGGIYAIAHVRGGGEKGEIWYRGGYKENKPNSWKDVISCTEYLIKNGYTSSENIALAGQSAGAIAVGRAVIDRPNLFKAAVIEVGILNTLRLEYSSNTVNTSEFGSIEDSIGFNYLYEMDVYQNIQENTIYPSILFTTGMNDSRVDPWIPAKAVAKMQQVCRNQDNVILFRISGDGHFGDSSIEEEQADIYSFLFWQLGHPDFKLKNDFIK